MRMAEELRRIHDADVACGDIDEAEDRLARNLATAPASRNGRSAAPARDEHPVRAGKPLDPPNLTIIQEGIALADLSTMIRRQSICAVIQGQKPRVVFDEIYTSMQSLRWTLTPNVDLHANRWLLQALTEYLDGRMIEYLTWNDDAITCDSFSVNLNLSTLLSSEFLELGKILRDKVRGSIIIELQLVDVYSDLGNYFRARDTLRERGFKFCLDGMNHHSLPLIDRETLGFDLVKLFWHPDLYDQLEGAQGDKLRRAAQQIGPERLILARCDSEQALQVGRSLGSALYQGRLIDGLLQEPVSHEEPFEDIDARRVGRALMAR